MTKQNCIRLLKHYENIGRKDAFEDMKAHILKGSKFTPQEKEALFASKPVVTKSKEKK